MASMIVELLWDEKELSEGWMNIDNLKACLYGKTHVDEAICQVREMHPKQPQEAQSMPDSH